MYFPSDMTFQYFFFDTYPGFFLQVLPYALIAGIIYGVIKFRKDKQTPKWRKICAILFVCYLTGLVGLVALLDPIHELWYRMFYHMPGGGINGFFSGEFDLVPDFFLRITGEMIANVLMFMPFGILYPLSKADSTWKKTLLAGIVCTVTIEVLQPIFGRSFDLNDIIMNTFGVLIAATAFFACKRLWKKKN